MLYNFEIKEYRKTNYDYNKIFKEGKANLKEFILQENTALEVFFKNGMLITFDETLKDIRYFDIDILRKFLKYEEDFTKEKMAEAFSYLYKVRLSFRTNYLYEAEKILNDYGHQFQNVQGHYKEIFIKEIDCYIGTEPYSVSMIDIKLETFNMGVYRVEFDEGYCNCEIFTDKSSPAPFYLNLKKIRRFIPYFADEHYLMENVIRNIVACKNLAIIGIKSEEIDELQLNFSNDLLVEGTFQKDIDIKNGNSLLEKRESENIIIEDYKFLIINKKENENNLISKKDFQFFFEGKKKNLYDCLNKRIKIDIVE